MRRSFLIAARFLTRLPMPDPGPVSDPDLGHSAVFFPLVGLLLGLMVWALMVWSLSMLPAEFSGPDPNRAAFGGHSPSYGLAAALVLVAWVGLTGGLHLDGLADTADAWIGGLGDRNRTLEIMQDPSSGPFGVMALVLVLLCKWAALSALMTTGAVVSLIWIPVLARTQLLILFLTTPSARPDGMGAVVRAHLPRTAAWAWLVVTLVASALFLGTEWPGLVVAAGVLFLLLRRFVMTRLGGFSGDTAGALVELSEALMLAAVVFFS
ncbi:adenosylcobinamide-GDP ribazoletransferase [Candidatus Thiosymbion oneisti]|uniref:adenosylcobinamide-GDP ribazoletransferase n=1 Tax=Candidatus Thiosymbion oneisti TaxID=589554 RepID=UPI000AA61657|nr:adenosylcobinamide-GDP ribazoletransferase [Candidatus Thiosymbion oneisti]